MEQNTTEIQIEDTSGLRGFKLIKRYLARTYGIGPDARQNLFGKPEEMALTKQQSLFLWGIGILSYIVTCGFLLTILSFFTDLSAIDFSFNNQSFANSFWVFVCTCAILMPLGILLIPLLILARERSEEEFHRSTFYLVGGLFAYLFYTDPRATSDINTGIAYLTFVPIFLVRMFAYEIRDNAKLRDLIGKSEKLANSLGDRLNKVFSIKS